MTGVSWGSTSSDFFFDVSTGKIKGVRHLYKFGENADIDSNSLPETVWPPGGLWVPPTQARVHSIESDSADDALTGIGARTVTVAGLDQNFDEISEVVEMDGTNPVFTAKDYRRINRLRVATAGASQVNEGLITATALTDATVSATIPATLGSTSSAIFTVPRGHKAWLLGVDASIRRVANPSGAQATCRLMGTGSIDTPNPVTTIRDVFALSAEGDSNIERTYKTPRDIPGPFDLQIIVTDVSDNTTIVNASFALIYSRRFRDSE